MTGLGLAGLADIAANAILDGVTLLFKDIILNIVANQLGNALEEILHSIPPLLPLLPTTEPPPATTMASGPLRPFVKIY